MKPMHFAFWVVGSLVLTVLRLDAQTNFDLRTAGPGGVSWVASVQNQSLLGDCWTFSSATMIDSNLLKNGLLPTSTTPPEIQVSSWHLSTRNGAPEWLPFNSTRNDWEADNGRYNWGGFHWMTLGYLTRGAGEWPVVGGDPPNTIPTLGGGPVLVSQNSLNAFPLSTIQAKQSLEPTLPPAEQNPAFQTRQVLFYDQKGSRRGQRQQVEAVKQALQNYGALTTYMYASVPSFQQNGDPMLYRGSKQANHSVTIIGWDDNYVIRGRKGAWIVQNSWGTTWGQNEGLFYASYFDKYIGRSGVMAVEMAEMGTANAGMLQNELGPVELSGANNPLGMGALPRSATRNKNEVAGVIAVEEAALLTAIGLATHEAGAHLAFSIYSGFDPSTGPLGSPVYTSGNLTFSGMGYQVFDLEAPLTLNPGGDLVVVVDYQDRLEVVPFVLGPESGVQSGLSYFRSPRGWTDFSGFGPTGGTLFLKGITSPVPEVTSMALEAFAIPEPSTVVLILVGVACLWLTGTKAARSSRG